MGHALGVRKVCGLIVNDQVFSINALADRTVAKRAEINLFEGCAAEAQHKQHPVSVRVILCGRAGQIMVHIRLKGISQHIGIGIAATGIIIAHLDGAIGRQKLRPCIGLKPQHSLQQKRMANLAHTLNRSAVSGPLKARNFNLKAQQADTLRPVLNPLPAALKVRINTPHQVIGNTRQFRVINLFRQIIKPARRVFIVIYIQRLALKVNGDRAIRVVNTEQFALIVNFVAVFALICIGNNDFGIFRQFANASRFFRHANIGVQTGRKSHLLIPQTGYSGVSA